ncbi:hypothetical protein [Streptomyces sp. NPDC126499]|uniref:hypothetical protein n=1 Tax=Streptomyces sp. NPDC126499 TaxID=3155314 RepID=UPI0033235750
MSESTDTTPVSEPAGAPEGAETSPPSSSSDAPLGPAGEKALTEWKQRARAAEKASREQAARLQELEDRDKSELQKATERAAKADARAAEAARRVAKAEIRALAAPQFADPSDAAAFLNVDELIGDDGDVDTKAVEKALADLLKRKPHLAKEQAPPSFDGGARTTATPPTDMNALIRQKAGLG